MTQVDIYIQTYWLKLFVERLSSRAKLGSVQEVKCQAVGVKLDKFQSLFCILAYMPHLLAFTLLTIFYHLIALMSVTIQNSSLTHAYAFRGPGNQSQIGSRAGSQSKMRRQRSTIADLVTVMRANKYT